MKKPKLPDGPYEFDHIPDKFDSSYDEMHLCCQSGEIRLASLNVRWSAPHIAEPLALGRAMAAIPALLAALESAYTRSKADYEHPHCEHPDAMRQEMLEYQSALESAGYEFSDNQPE